MFTLNCKGTILSLEEPVVMGILNITPDSFYKESRYKETNAIVEKAGLMKEAGALIIDMGGQSTHPNSEWLSASEEMDRVLPAVEAVYKALPGTVISIDTFYAEVAGNAVNAGASMINDISGGSLDTAMTDVVADLNVPYILMHMKGTPQTMQQHTSYENVTTELLDYFIKKLHFLRGKGIKDIIIDPGFGFAKNASHNFRILREFSVFKMLNCPLLAGLSRKSTIYKTLGLTAHEALNGTSVLNTVALMNGANILRVHDVKEAREAIQLIVAMQQA